MKRDKIHRGYLVKALGMVALLLVALSGIASANLIKSVDVSPNHIYPGQDVTVTVKMEDKTPDVEIRIYTKWLDEVAYSMRPDDFDPDNPDLSFYSDGPFCSGFTKNGIFVTQFNYPCYSYFYYNRFGVLCYDNWGMCDSKGVYLNVSPETKVPEFPSVVVPVAAILGLLFVFGKKKKSIE